MSPTEKPTKYIDQERIMLQHVLENNHFPIICQTPLMENIKKSQTNKLQMLD